MCWRGNRINVCIDGVFKYSRIFDDETIILKITNRQADILNAVVFSLVDITCITVISILVDFCSMCKSAFFFCSVPLWSTGFSQLLGNCSVTCSPHRQWFPLFALEHRTTSASGVHLRHRSSQLVGRDVTIKGLPREPALLPLTYTSLISFLVQTLFSSDLDALTFLYG